MDEKLTKKVLEHIAKFNGNISRGFEEGGYNHRMNFQFRGNHVYHVGNMMLKTTNFKFYEVTWNNAEIGTIFNEKLSDKIYNALQTKLDSEKKTRVNTFLNS